ncbi:MAG: anthranilate synthase component I, partial [Tistlia sp.]
MEVTPDFAAFEAAYRAGTPQVVSTRLIADLETPVSAYLKLAEGRPYSFLFESVEGGSTIGRYSFITMKPDLIWRAKGGRCEINRRARYAADAFEPMDGPPLEELRRLVRANDLPLPPGAPPMAASLIGYLGYDMVRHMERLPDGNADPLDVPDSIFVRPTVTCVFDRVEDLITVFTPVHPQPEVGATAAYDRALERLGEVAQ